MRGGNPSTEVQQLTGWQGVNSHDLLVAEEGLLISPVM